MTGVHALARLRIFAVSSEHLLLNKCGHVVNSSFLKSWEEMNILQRDINPEKFLKFKVAIKYLWV